MYLKAIIWLAIKTDLSKTKNDYMTMRISLPLNPRVLSGE